MSRYERQRQKMLKKEILVLLGMLFILGGTMLALLEKPSIDHADGYTTLAYIVGCLSIIWGMRI